MWQEGHPAVKTVPKPLMIRMFQQDLSMARAFPVSNMQDPHLNPVRNEQGLPGLG